MKNSILILFAIFVFSCNNDPTKKINQKNATVNKTDLKEFNTFHEDFFFESSLFKDSKKSEFHKTLNFLSKKDLSYDKDGAIWYKSTDFGDEKDRVLIRENEAPTYFASDLVYHKNKFDRNV